MTRGALVWDPLVRIFHWTLATACVLNLWVLESGEDWHRWIGYYAAGAVVVRILWGFVGTPYARFSSFWPTPRRLLFYLRALLRGEHPYYVGHNPLGGLMILALMGLVLALGISGWMMGLDRYWGEAWLEELHGLFANTLMVLILIHIAVVVLYSLLGSENLIKAMITGRKDEHR